MREIAAPPEAVFEVLTDHASYSELTPLRKSELEREGEADVNGVGAIRKLTAVGPPMREEVIAYEAPSRFSYTVLSGLPVRDHVGTVELAPNGGGTRMVYAVQTQPTLPARRLRRRRRGQAGDQGPDRRGCQGVGTARSRGGLSERG